MNVDVEIYLSNIIKFFNNNQQELKNLIPLEKKNEFYEKIRQAAIKNSTSGSEVSLTQQQLIEICVEINNKNTQILSVREGVIQKTLFGEFSLN
jgi:hypothetical protein